MTENENNEITSEVAENTENTELNAPETAVEDAHEETEQPVEEAAETVFEDAQREESGVIGEEERGESSAFRTQASEAPSFGEKPAENAPQQGYYTYPNGWYPPAYDPRYPDPRFVQGGYPQNMGQAPYGAPQSMTGYPTGGYPYPQWAEPQKPKKKKMSGGLKAFIAVACVLVVISLAGFGGYIAANLINRPNNGSFGEVIPNIPGMPQLPDNGNNGGATPSKPDGDSEVPKFDDGVEAPEADDPLPEIDVTPNNEGITIDPLPGGETLTAQEVYEKVVKSTVTVAATRSVNGMEQTSTGTGIIVTSDGYIITNSHVVINSKSTRVKITANDGEEYDAVVVGLDRTTDLAVLKTNDHGFTPASFGDSDKLCVGDTVIAIGNPGGTKFSGSMTGGYVSGLDRLVGSYSESGMTYIQTDAAINPGNSGGPLVNMYGQVVGINSSKIVTTGYEGMGFSIPSTKAKAIIDQLMSGGYVRGRVRLGIVGTDAKNTTYSMMGIQGFVITEINEVSSFNGTTAQEGDVIIAVEGETVTGLSSLSNELLKYAPGDRITVTLYRPNANGGAEMKFEVVVILLEDKGETQG